jgi:hypothetical protein
MVMWVHPLSMTAAKHHRPSLVTIVLGRKLVFAYLAVASDVKPMSMSSLSRIGIPVSIVKTAATKRRAVEISLGTT